MRGSPVQFRFRENTALPSYSVCKIELQSEASYFGGARNKGFAMLRNVSKLTFFDKIGHAKSVGFRF